MKQHRPGITVGLIAAALASVAVAACVAPSAIATTGVAYTIEVPVQMHGSQLSLKKNEFTVKGLVRYPRGTTVHFHIRNTTKKTIRPQLRVLSGLNFFGGSKFSKITKAPHTILPGKTGRFDVYFFFRGKMSLQAVTAGKVVASAPLSIF